MRIYLITSKGAHCLTVTFLARSLTYLSHHQQLKFATPSSPYSFVAIRATHVLHVIEEYRSQHFTSLLC